jgi:ATP-binding cassette subfamily B protein
VTERNNTGIESSPPPSCEDLEEEARTRPKSIRLLPRICSDALRLVWAASPRGLVASVVLKVVGGLGLAAALLLSRGLVASILSAGAQQTGVGAVAPKLAAVVGVIVALGLVAAAGREVREVLSENTVRHAKQRIIEVTTAVELSAYETPAFHNRLVRATAGEHRPIQLVDGLIGTVGAVAGVGGIVVALLAIQPWLVPLLLLAGLPLTSAAGIPTCTTRTCTSCAARHGIGSGSRSPALSAWPSRWAPASPACWRWPRPAGWGWPRPPPPAAPSSCSANAS